MLHMEARGGMATGDRGACRAMLAIAIVVVLMQVIQGRRRV
jgi:hypothetical protein